MGWYAMALVDMLPDIPAEPDAPATADDPTGMASALRTTQDPTTGLWFQVVDRGADRRLDRDLRRGMFVYALKVASTAATSIRHS